MEANEREALDGERASLRHFLEASYRRRYADLSSRLFEGQRRATEVGVLFDRDVDLAERVGSAIAETGLVVGMNEPYSGRQGMMYSAERHADAAGKRALELEVRQDLAVVAAVRGQLVDAVHRALTGAESAT